jgi:hypothetical protein
VPTYVSSFVKSPISTGKLLRFRLLRFKLTVVVHVKMWHYNKISSSKNALIRELSITSFF